MNAFEVLKLRGKRWYETKYDGMDGKGKRRVDLGIKVKIICKGRKSSRLGIKRGIKNELKVGKIAIGGRDQQRHTLGTWNGGRTDQQQL